MTSRSLLFVSSIVQHLLSICLSLRKGSEKTQYTRNHAAETLGENPCVSNYITSGLALSLVPAAPLIICAEGAIASTS